MYEPPRLWRLALSTCHCTMVTWPTTSRDHWKGQGRHPICLGPVISKNGWRCRLGYIRAPTMGNDTWLQSVLDSNALMPPRQSAYRRLHSTDTAVTKVFNDPLQAADDGEISVLCLLDLCLGGAAVWALDFRSSGSGFDLKPGHNQLSLPSFRGRWIDYQPYRLGLRRGVFAYVELKVKLCDTWSGDTP